ncbi:hypothetical protein NPIL_163131 [Nephila pilipes]|uniref:Uncharacterized protein n=1 Tax=Nephila pilipes TaxID=299642 RepID=A0A8X6PJS2_NEPPI|nr:hypothetical protein NPIL_163131 [Nephila pilipes]
MFTSAYEVFYPEAITEIKSYFSKHSGNTNDHFKAMDFGHKRSPLNIFQDGKGHEHKAWDNSLLVNVPRVGMQWMPAIMLESLAPSH